MRRWRDLPAAGGIMVLHSGFAVVGLMAVVGWVCFTLWVLGWVGRGVWVGVWSEMHWLGCFKCRCDGCWLFCVFVDVGCLWLFFAFGVGCVFSLRWLLGRRRGSG